MSTTHDFTDNDYRIIKKETLYQGFFQLSRYTLQYRLFNQGWSNIFTNEVLERKSASAVLPYDPILDKVILIEQFRAGSLANPQSPWLIEIPAGLIEEGEEPAAVAYREAVEEANCKIVLLQPICELFVSPGGSNEYLNIYCGKVDARTIEGIHGLAQENEDIRVINIPLHEALAMLYAGRIKTAPALIALLWLQGQRQALQEKWLSP
jgi:ADP-ribose pyrophosphatase